MTGLNAITSASIAALVINAKPVPMSTEWMHLRGVFSHGETLLVARTFPWSADWIGEGDSLRHEQSRSGVMVYAVQIDLCWETAFRQHCGGWHYNSYVGIDLVPQ